MFLSSKCSLFHNSNVFGSCIIHILYTGGAKIKKKKFRRQKDKASAEVQEVSRRPLIAKNRGRSHSSPCEICDEQSDIGTGFSSGISLSPLVSVILLLPHIHLHLRVAFTRRTSGRRLGTLKKAI